MHRDRHAAQPNTITIPKTQTMTTDDLNDIPHVVIVETPKRHPNRRV